MAEVRLPGQLVCVYIYIYIDVVKCLLKVFIHNSAMLDQLSCSCFHFTLLVNAKINIWLKYETISSDKPQYLRICSCGHQVFTQ